MKSGTEGTRAEPDRSRGLAFAVAGIDLYLSFAFNEKTFDCLSDAIDKNSGTEPATVEIYAKSPILPLALLEIMQDLSKFQKYAFHKGKNNGLWKSRRFCKFPDASRSRNGAGRKA